MESFCLFLMTPTPPSLLLIQMCCACKRLRSRVCACVMLHTRRRRIPGGALFSSSSFLIFKVKRFVQKERGVCCCYCCFVHHRSNCGGMRSARRLFVNEKMKKKKFLFSCADAIGRIFFLLLVFMGKMRRRRGGGVFFVQVLNCSDVLYQQRGFWSEVAELLSSAYLQIKRLEEVSFLIASRAQLFSLILSSASTVHFIFLFFFFANNQLNKEIGPYSAVGQNRSRLWPRRTNFF